MRWLPVLALLAGCKLFLPAPVPMHQLEYRADPKTTAKCLLLLLPGAGDDDRAFSEHRFIDAVRARHLDVDVIAADARMGYYVRGIVWDRLSEDILAPARARGYSRVWMAGISMGGLGTLMYARRHPGELNGLVVMAPFLGEKSVLQEIELSGGLRKWHAPPKADPITEDNYQLELWRWMQAVTGGTEPGPAMYVGFGKDDRLAPAARLLATELPADHVFETAGIHDWGPWLEQWTKFLDHSSFASDCSPGSK